MSLRLTNCSFFDKNLTRADGALQIEAGIIMALGSMAESSNWPRSEREISLDGRIVFAGLMDAHMHLENWALRHSQISLDSARSLAEVLSLLTEQVRIAEGSGQSKVIILAGWNEENYPEQLPPSLQELDAISSQIPIILSRICGHVCVVNSAVLREFDWQSFAETEPGSVGLAENGRPNGILSENAMFNLLSLQEKYSKEQQKELLAFGLKSMAAYGLTAVASQETGSLQDVDFLSALEDIYETDPDLPAYYAQIGLSDPEEISDFLALREQYRTHPQIKIASVKLFKDGSLGGRTALLREVYSDDTSTSGLDLIPYEELVCWFEQANAAGVQLTIHAIGDRAVAEIVDAFTAAAKTDADRSNYLRHTIIHCQITDAKLLQRLAQSQLLVITQPLFAASDWQMAQARLGDKRRNAAYDYRAALDLGIHQAFSSDSPVESANPLLTLAAALDHPQPEKSLSLQEALAASTENVAYVLGEEESRGELRVGATADLSVVQADSFDDLTAEKLRRTEIALTIRAGRIIHRAQDF